MTFSKKVRHCIFTTSLITSCRVLWFFHTLFCSQWKNVLVMISCKRKIHYVNVKLTKRRALLCLLVPGCLSSIKIMTGGSLKFGFLRLYITSHSSSFKMTIFTLCSPFIHFFIRLLQFIPKWSFFFFSTSAFLEYILWCTICGDGSQAFHNKPHDVPLYLWIKEL